MAEVLDRLLDEGVDGRRIALQLHGEPLPGFVESLRAGGRRGRRRARLPVDAAGGPRAPSTGCSTRPSRGGLDALTFTSAPAAASLLSRAEQRGLLRELLDALRHDVLAACVGPVTALPLQAHGVDTVQPERFRLGPLVQLLCQELPGRARALPLAGHRVEIRGHAVLVDGDLRPVPPAGMSLLRALARRPGWVVAARRTAAGAARGRPRRARRGDGDGPAAHGAGRAQADPDGRQAGLPAGPGPAADSGSTAPGTARTPRKPFSQPRRQPIGERPGTGRPRAD